MIADEIRAALKERLRVMEETDDNWDYGIDKCCKKEVKILSEDISETIHFFTDECTDEEFFWLSEIFSDVAEKTKSSEFVQCLRDRLARVRPETYDQASFNTEHMRKWIDYKEYARSTSLDIDYADGALLEVNE